MLSHKLIPGIDYLYLWVMNIIFNIKKGFQDVYKNQVAIVTGSGRGVGAAVAVNLAEKGVKIVLNYLNDSESVKKIQKKSMR